MSSAPTTIQPSLTADQLTVIVASVSCLVFLVVILLLLAILYREEPLCCKVDQRSQNYTDAPPQYHNSRQSLVGYSYDEHSSSLASEGLGIQLPGRVFIIGKPSSYHLDEALPRLPSYESVRKKDRQRQIHSMIADRFGLCGTHADPAPPPTYEETLRQSVEIPVDLQSVDTHSPGQPPTTATQGALLSRGTPWSNSREPLSL